MRRLIHQDFIKALEPNLSEYVKNKIEDYAFCHKDILPWTLGDYILRIIKVLFGGDVVRAGESRLLQWEDGWEQNLTDDTIMPKYYNKHDVVRWHQRFVVPVSSLYEVNMLYLIVDWLADKYMREVDAVYEFGCGTGHHLDHIRMVNADAVLYGLDWTLNSQNIINKHAGDIMDDKLLSRQFDFFHPDYTFKLKKNSVVYTVAALEQVGTNYEEFIAYLYYHKPKLCIHIEPIAELLDEDNLLDYLSIQYFRKRNYLRGFLTFLRDLEKEGTISILRQQRTYIGSFFIEGYSVVVWTPQI